MSRILKKTFSFQFTKSVPNLSVALEARLIDLLVNLHLTDLAHISIKKVFGKLYEK